MSSFPNCLLYIGVHKCDYQIIREEIDKNITIFLIFLVNCMLQWAAVCHYFSSSWIDVNFLGDYLASFFPLIFVIPLDLLSVYSIFTSKACSNRCCFKRLSSASLPKSEGWLFFNETTHTHMHKNMNITCNLKNRCFGITLRGTFINFRNTSKSI